MTKYKYILFDLDGTITDSAEGIINSILYALDKLGIQVGDKKELKKFVGPPLLDSFMNIYGLSKEEAEKAIGEYRIYFKEKGIYENSVYAGIEEVFKEIRDRGIDLILTTSKLEIFAKRIMEHYKLDKYFTFIGGASLDGKRVKKSHVISYALEACKIEDRSRVIMVGDREHDILGAKENGLASIGVLYGYGDRRELEEAGADYIVESPNQIKNYI